MSDSGFADGTATPATTGTAAGKDKWGLFRASALLIAQRASTMQSSILPHRLDNRGNLFWQIILPETRFGNCCVPVIWAKVFLPLASEARDT